MNTQPTESKFIHPQGALQLHHCFPTIQGEGPFAGTPAIFVRLAGCNLQCPACDTDYTSKRQTVSPHEIISDVERWVPEKRRHRQLVVITGGEPFRQNIKPLVIALYERGYRAQIETNGTLFPEGGEFPVELCTIVCSPKTGKINASLARYVAAFKYVVQAGFVHPADGLPISTLGQIKQTEVARPPVGSLAEIYVQPLDEQDVDKNRANTEAAVQSCLTFGYRLCIQTHKLANLE